MSSSGIFSIVSEVNQRAIAPFSADFGAVAELSGVTNVEKIEEENAALTPVATQNRRGHCCSSFDTSWHIKFIVVLCQGCLLNPSQKQGL